MSDKRTFHLITDRVRTNALEAVRSAADNSIVTVSPPKRTDDQNAKMWAMLHDVAKSRPEGRQWVPETWKCAFMHSLGHQVMFCEGLEGAGPFPIGFRTSKLKVGQMADLITCIQKYGDDHGVAWSYEEETGW